MKRRIISLLLVCGLALSLSACGKKEEIPAQKETPPIPAESSVPEKSEPEQEIRTLETVTVNGVELGMGLDLEKEAAAAVDENPDRSIDRAVTPILPVPDAMLDGTPLSEEFYHYRSTLDDTLRQAYDLLRANMLKGTKKIKMTVPVKTEDIFNVYKMVIFDSPEMVWASTNGMRYYYNNHNEVTFLEPSYNDLVEDIGGSSARFESAAAEALADIWSLPTQVEKAKYAHDYLTHHIDYVLDAPYNQSGYSAIVNSETVCAGYAHAFQYLMQQVGIPCAYVLGYVQGGYHAWNLVKLDGEYYAMDVTWDDPIGAGPEDYYYDYFNITDTKISVDHLRAEISMPLPVASGTVCSFSNAFGGTAYGTDFSAVAGVMPEKVGGEEGNAAEGNPYLS